MTLETGKQPDLIAAPAVPNHAARKQVTVVFCDIADYAERASVVDPEVLSEEIREFQSICQRVAEQYDGHISNYLGDGIMVLFGHPVASELTAATCPAIGHFYCSP